jgi:hypothetical protein
VVDPLLFRLSKIQGDLLNRSADYEKIRPDIRG